MILNRLFKQKTTRIHWTGLTITCLVWFISLGNLSAQRFYGGVIGGMSISQLNGDEAYGFNKISPFGGVKAGYNFPSRLNLELELLYNEKGSQRANKFKNQSPFWSIDLHYFEIPLLVGFKDWQHKDGFYHMVFYTGLSWAYLFNSEVTNLKYKPVIENDLRQNDFAWLIGATYQVNRHLGVTGRYNRSLTKVWRKKVADDNYSNYMLGYQFSLGLQYLF